MQLRDGRMADADTRPRKVVIVGGGMAALACAWDLTSERAQREGGYEVTLLQPGWRLGGKGASGRRGGPSHQRVEEHGLHVLSGLYANVFEILHEAYRARGRDRGAPLSRLTQAFVPADRIHLFETRDDPDTGEARVVRWSIPNPRSAARPWNPIHRGPMPLSDLLLLAWHAWRHGRFPEPPADDGMGDDDAVPDAPTLVRLGATLISGVTLFLFSFTKARRLRTTRRALVRGALRLQRAAWERVRARIDDDDVRRRWQLWSFGVANLLGWYEAEPWRLGYAHLDDQDYADWLSRYLVDDGLTAAGPLPRFLYEAQFSRPRASGGTGLAAGVALRILVRMAAWWNGALVWTMQAGMGDVVFAPLYEVLRRRGVRFRFFRRVEAVEVHDGAVEGLRVGIQARVSRAGGEYDPLVDVRGLPCWPAEPDWDQLADGDQHREAGADFEDPDHPASEHHDLRRGVDFDDVVLAVPLPVVRRIAPDLEAIPRWRRAFEQGATTATQAAQVWLTRSGPALGNPPGAWLASYDRHPASSVGDVSHVLDWEDWPDDARPAALAYACGPVPDGTPTDHPDDVRQLVTERLGPLYPEAVHPDGRTDPDAIWPPDAPDPLDPRGVYLRRNTRPSERFHLSPPGTIAHRIAPGATGVSGLVVAGDWTRTGLDLSNLEATALSGRLAARAVRGASPAGTDVPREGPYRELPQRLRAFGARRRMATLAAIVLGMLSVLAATSVALVPVLRASYQLPRCVPLHCPPEAWDGVAPLGYTVSLVLFLLPGLALYAWGETIPLAPHQTRAVQRTTLAVLAMGAFLDVVFAGRFFEYPNHDAVIGLWLPGLSWDADLVAWFPVEELLFYAAGGYLMTMVYVIGDQRLFDRYHPSHRDLVLGEPGDPWAFAKRWVILTLAVTVGAACLAGAWHDRAPWEDPPLYLAFLLSIGVIPLADRLASLLRLINWRALLAAFLVVQFLSLLYEATLGLPYGYWAYQPRHMLGPTIPPWSNAPIEAVLMWLVATPAVGMLYELSTRADEAALES